MHRVGVLYWSIAGKTKAQGNERPLERKIYLRFNSTLLRLSCFFTLPSCSQRSDGGEIVKRPRQGTGTVTPSIPAFAKRQVNMIRSVL